MPADPSSHTAAWIRFGLAAGVVAMAVYMLLFLLPGPDRLLLALVATLAPLLAASAVAVHRLVALQGERGVALDVGAGAVAVSGIVFTLMGLVQLAVRNALGATLEAGGQIGGLQRGLDGVRYGLDLGWDLGFALGAILVAWAMRRHPRFGWLYTVPGIAAGAAVVGVAFASYPQDPVSAGLFDLGPVLALWWLAITARGVLSWGWVEERLGLGAEPGEI